MKKLAHLIVLNSSRRVGFSLNRFNKVNIILKTGSKVILANSDQTPELSSKIIKHHELFIYTVSYLINDKRS